MKQIIVSIEPHEDGRCGECDGIERPDPPFTHCGVFGFSFSKDDRDDPRRMKCCLAAEEKLKRLVEAGNKLRAGVDEYWDSAEHSAEGWDAALAALEEK